jgi:hypothetical protein
LAESSGVSIRTLDKALWSTQGTEHLTNADGENTAANQAAGAAVKGAAAAAKKRAKPAAVATAAWLAKKFGDKVAYEGYNNVKSKREKAASAKAQESLAQELCRARGWKYQRFVVDHAQGFVVWSDDKKPMAAFPPVEDARTPDQLAGRFELDGYTPADKDLIEPPPKH